MNSQPIHIPTYMVELMHQWRYLASQLESKLGAPPTLQQMAKHATRQNRPRILLRAYRLHGIKQSPAGGGLVPLGNFRGLFLRYLALASTVLL